MRAPEDCPTMKWGVPLIIILLVLGPVGMATAAVGGGASAAQTQMVTITASIVDNNDNPIGGVEVTAEWDGGSTTRTTASNGKVFIDAPKDADVAFKLKHDDYVRNHAFRLRGATERELSITMYPKASASATIVDADGPIKGAAVEFRRHGRAAVRATTDSNGVVKTGVVEAGEYTVLVFKPGYYKKQVTMEVKDQSSQEITLKHGFVTIAFRVVDDNFVPPKPVAEASITGQDIGSVKTQSNGIQRVSLPVNTKTTVTVQKDGFDTVKQTVKVGERGKTVNISTEKNAVLSIHTVNDRMVVGENLYVEVTDQYGNAMTDATVYVDDEPVGSPGDEGIVLVPIKSAGEHTIHAESGDQVSEKLTVSGVEPMTESSEEASSEDQRFVRSGLVVYGIDLKSVGIGVVVGIGLVSAMLIAWKIRG